MIRTLLALIAAIALSSCGKTSESASQTKSEYPSTYEISSSCQTIGAVEMCRGMQGGGAVAVHVRYRGFLKGKENLTTFMRIHNHDGDREGRFEMDAAYPPQYAGSFRLATITNGCLVGQLGGCAARGTEAMRDILFWAGRAPMRFNALDIEVAIDAGNGEWDSQYGQNYHFYFPGN